jgi:hypothetical protein
LRPKPSSRTDTNKGGIKHIPRLNFTKFWADFLFLSVAGNEAEVEGTLSVQPQANPVKGFEEYFLNLSVTTNERNPWFTGMNFSISISLFQLFSALVDLKSHK